MKMLKLKILQSLAAALPAAALAISLPIALLAPHKQSVVSNAKPAENSTAVRQAIAPANRQSAEIGFDAFLQSSVTGLPNAAVKGNALSAMYAAIGQTVEPGQAVLLNANNSRDLLNRLSDRDTGTALSGGWTLNLSTSNFDGISLSALSFLQYFPSLTGLSLVSLAGSVSPNPAGFVISSLQDVIWISAIKGLRTLRIVNDPAKNPTQFDSAELSILSDLPLTTVDFSRFFSPTTSAPNRPIFASLNLTLPWYLTMPYAFTIQMPANFAVAPNNALYNVQTGDGTMTAIVKAVAPKFADPNPANRSVYMDGSRYDAVLADSKLIWPFGPTTVSGIAFTDAAKNYYSTGGSGRFPVTKRTLSQQEIQLYNRYDTESKRPADEIFRVLRLENTGTNNETYINDTVIVDGRTVPRVMQNGVLYWAFNQKQALYRNDKRTKFWTSYERISAEDLNQPADTPSEKIDKIQTISATISGPQVDRSDIYLKAIEPPTGEAQVFTVNTTPIAAIRDLRDTTSNKYFWDFDRQGFRPEQIMFYSTSTLHAFTSVSELIAEQNRNENFKYAAYSSAKIATFDSLPTDSDPADLPSDISGVDAVAAYLAKNTDAKVSIDGKLYGYVLRNGTLFVDADTSKINFVAVSGTTKLYYTTASQIPANQVANVRLLRKIQPRTIPNQRAILTPNLSLNTPLTTISLNNAAETLQYGINNGKLYWRFAGSTVSGLSKIKYVDNTGGYYTLSMFDLSAETVVSLGLTEVVPTPDDVNSTTSGFATSLLLSQQLDRISYFFVGLYDKITIDNTVSYTRRIAHSRVYWLDANGTPLNSFAAISLQEFDGTTEQLVETPYFYTTNQRAFAASKSFPQKVRQISPPLVVVPAAEIEPVEVKDPTDASQTLKVYTKGVLVNLVARRYSDEQTPFIWSDKDIVEQIKYAAKQADGSYVYLTELNEEVWKTPAIETLDITEAKVSVAQAIITRDALFQDNVYEIEVVKYALIGVFSALFAAAAGVFLWRVFRKRVRNV